MTIKSPLKTLSFVILGGLTLLASHTYAAPTQPKLSVQLWSIKDDVSADFEGTLKKLSAMGFQGVEFAGNFGKYATDPAGLKKFLKDNHLSPSGAHVPLEKFSAENFDATVAFYKAIDCTYLIVPYDKRTDTIEGATQLAKELTAIEEKLKTHGLHTGFHNHKTEMLDINGTTTWDVIAKGTPNSVILEQDVGWTEVAKKDPVDIVKRYPGRIFATHYKAAAPEPGNTENAIIGKDTTDWKSLITINKTVGGTEWLVVEQEVYPEGMTPMQSVEASLKGLQSILKDMDKKK